jgi:hypothetical protein
MTRLTAAVLLAFGVIGARLSSQDRTPITPTAVVHFDVRSEDLARVPVSGVCSVPSRTAWFREDALTCRAQTASYDPCFLTPREHLVICVTDPRSDAGRVALKVTSAPTRQPAPARPVQLAWFFELADGTTCRPLPAPGREVEGQIELYECRFGTDGPADGVFGELDSTGAVWTISKVKLNKVLPITIKWSASVAVKAVWR